MLFLSIPPTPKAIINKVITDSGAGISIWPADAEIAEWIKVNDQKSLGQLHTWLQAKSLEKVSYIDQATDDMRKALQLPIAQDFIDYNKVFDVIKPYLSGKTMHPYPKFTGTVANDALTGFKHNDPSKQPVQVEVKENNFTLYVLLGHDHLINITMILTESDKSYTGKCSFNVPKKTPPAAFKPFFLKYLTDPNYTFTQGKKCFEDFVADQKKREEQNGGESAE